MPRPLVTAVVALVAVVVTAGPAGAHARFEGANEYPSGSTQRLTVHVPDELDAVGVVNVKVDLFTSPGWVVPACEAVPPWSCSTGTEGERAKVSWTKDPAAGAAPADETFVFTAVVGPPGTATFPVNQTYSNGEVARWIGDPGADKPAPKLTVTPGAAPSTAPTPSSSTTAAPSSTSSGPAAPSSTTRASSAVLPGGGGGDEGAGLPWLLLVAVGAVAGVGGMLALRGRRSV